MRRIVTVSIISAGLLAAVPVFAAEASAPPVPPQPGQEMPPQKPFGPMMSRMDTNGDGAITKEEFLAAQAAHFAKMDKNSDGKITPDEKPQRPRGGRPDGRGGMMPPMGGTGSPLFAPPAPVPQPEK